MGQHPGIPVVFFLSLNTNQQKIRSNLQNIIEKETKKEKGKGGKSFITKCTKNRTSTLPQFCQLAEWKYCIGLSTELILLLQKFRYSKENVTKEKWWGYCALSGGIWKLCVFGIHVTALLKNASKQLQNSWDWVWAHTVVTIIQTSVVRMEESCCL